MERWSSRTMNGASNLHLLALDKTATEKACNHPKDPSEWQIHSDRNMMVHISLRSQLLGKSCISKVPCLSGICHICFRGSRLLLCSNAASQASPCALGLPSSCTASKGQQPKGPHPPPVAACSCSSACSRRKAIALVHGLSLGYLTYCLNTGFRYKN